MFLDASSFGASGRLCLLIEAFPGIFINPNKPNGFSHPYTLGESICHLRGVRCILFFTFVLFVIKNSVRSFVCDY